MILRRPRTFYPFYYPCNNNNLRYFDGSRSPTPSGAFWGHRWGHLAQKLETQGAPMLTEVAVKQAKPRDKVQNTQLRERQIALALCLSHSFKNLLLNLAVLAAHPKQGSGHIIGRVVSKLVCILTVSSHRGGALYCVHTGIQGL
jgi:hypothetical protein